MNLAINSLIDRGIVSARPVQIFARFLQTTSTRASNTARTFSFEGYPAALELRHHHPEETEFLATRSSRLGRKITKINSGRYHPT